MTLNEQYMHRCIELARLGQGSVAPNPMVGSVLVHEGIIIGEGYHKNYGEAHAEVNCINSVKPEHRHLIERATLYVSLEPCAHFGKTPPCADLIIKNKIPKVVIGCRDPFEMVAGKGIEKLKAAGIEITTGILENECQQLNKHFFTFHTKKRPYITLKWAQTADGKIAGNGQERLFISNEYTNRIVHKWRSEEAAMLVGTNTALLDNPALTNRLWPGRNPLRLVIDRNLRLPSSLKLFNDQLPVIVFNTKKHTMAATNTDYPPSSENAYSHNVYYYRLTDDSGIVSQIADALYQLKIQSLLIEGGAHLLQSFINEDLWDEARIITNEQLIIGNGLPAPVLKNYRLASKEEFYSDTIKTYTKQK